MHLDTRDYTHPDRLVSKLLYFLKGFIDLRQRSLFLRENDTRILKDRRMRPAPALSRFTLRGQRRAFRRREDQGRRGYVDQYSCGLLILLILPVGLTILDALFTMMILNDGGWEINPFVRSAIQLFGDRFWVWKFAIVSIPLILLCLHSKFRWVIPVLVVIASINVVVILYQIFLFIY
jgi:hypothetical protein